MYFASKYFGCPSSIVLGDLGTLRVVDSNEMIGGKPVAHYFKEGHAKITRIVPHPGREQEVRATLQRLHEKRTIRLLP